MRRFTIAVFLLSSFSLFSQDVTTLTLDEAVSYAEANDLDIKNARLNIQDADEQITERKASGLPKIDAGLDYQYYFAIPTAVLPAAFDNIARDPVTGMLPDDFSREVQFALRNNFNPGISLSTLIFDGSYLKAVKAARLYKEYVGQELIAKEKDLRDRVREAYLPPLIINENLTILNRNIDNLKKMLRETRATYEAGFIEQLDVDRLELSLSNLETEVENLQRQKQMALDVLKFTIGHPMDQEIDVADQLDVLLVDVPNVDLTENVNYYSRPEYKVAELGVELNKMNIEVNRLAFWPTLRGSLAYQYQYQGSQLFRGEDGFWAPLALGGISLNVPIFDGFNKRAKLERSKLQLAIAQNQKQSLERAIQLEVQTARTAYYSALESVNSQEKNLGLAEKIYETTQIKYREGVGSSIELIQDEQNLYQTQQNLVQARYDLLLAKIELDEALGK